MIIGLAGYAQSGKDTVAKFLVENHGFERVAFADPIRDLLYELNPIVGFEFDGGPWDLKYIVDSIWIIKALRTMSGDGNYVITDVRFQNEAATLRLSGQGAQIWRVERTGVNAVNDHVSEHDLDNWEFDSYIHNNSSLEDLEFAVKTRLMQRI